MLLNPRGVRCCLGPALFSLFLITTLPSPFLRGKDSSTDWGHTDWPRAGWDTTEPWFFPTRVWATCPACQAMWLILSHLSRKCSLQSKSRKRNRVLWTRRSILPVLGVCRGTLPFAMSLDPHNDHMLRFQAEGLFHSEKEKLSKHQAIKTRLGPLTAWWVNTSWINERLNKHDRAHFLNLLLSIFFRVCVSGGGGEQRLNLMRPTRYANTLPQSDIPRISLA